MPVALRQLIKGISKPDDFWNFIKSLNKNSISRVWYCGHASGDGLMLALGHNSSCGASASTSDMVLTDQIFKNSSLADRFVQHSPGVSKFYACFTSNFARKWNMFFGVPAEGAVNKVDFGTVNQTSTIPNILTRIEQTPDTRGRLPDWKHYP